MGLLTREGEIEIAKRIEDGINQVQCSVAEYPEAITYLLDQWDLYEAEEIRISDIISGFVDPDDEQDLAPTATHIGSELSEEELEDEDDDEEDEGGVDPEMARERFAELREQYVKTRSVIEAKGRAHADAREQITALSDIFKEFRLVPKQFDRMVKNMREMMDKVRIQERLVMKYCVVNAKMPKKDFIKSFAGNETSNAWLHEAVKSGAPYAADLAVNQEEIERCISKMNQVEQETGLVIADIK